MNCPSCQAEVRPGSTFCSTCGGALPPAARQDPAPPPSVPPTPPPDPPPAAPPPPQPPPARAKAPPGATAPRLAPRPSAIRSLLRFGLAAILGIVGAAQLFAGLAAYAGSSSRWDLASGTVWQLGIVWLGDRTGDDWAMVIVGTATLVGAAFLLMAARSGPLVALVLEGLAVATWLVSAAFDFMGADWLLITLVTGAAQLALLLSAVALFSLTRAEARPPPP